MRTRSLDECRVADRSLNFGFLSGNENYFMKAATRALPHFTSEVMEKMSYKPMGVFFSEGLALVSAVDIASGTHIIESGTAEGQSTEILARFYGN